MLHFMSQMQGVVGGFRFENNFTLGGKLTTRFSSKIVKFSTLKNFSRDHSLYSGLED